MTDRLPLEIKALEAISRHKMLSGGEKVVIGVSGGPDSVALLLFLSRHAERMKLALHVFHLDHMFRGRDSAEDADFVRELSREMGIPFKIDAVDVPSIVRSGGDSPQDVARRVRRERLMSYADEVEADRVALGHTADDQVETFLMRVIQGSGITGLGGIAPVSGRIIRPLIDVWRTEVEEYCPRMQVVPRIDESNLKQVYLRNRVRNSLIPFLEENFGARIKQVILREVESLALDGKFLEGEISTSFMRFSRKGEDEVRLDAAGLAGIPDSLRRGVLRKAWSELNPEMNSLSWSHIRDIERKIAGGRTGARLDLPGDVVVEREYGDIVFRAGGQEAGQDVRLEAPGSVGLPGTGMIIEVSEVGIEDVEFSDDPNVEFVNGDLLAFPLEIRPVRPGDRFHPLGSPGTKKLKDFFIDIKLPRRQRAGSRLVISNGQVVWVAGYRLDQRYRLRPESKAAIRLQLREPSEYDGHENE